MLAFVYLILAFLLGDAICRRFFTFASLGHRLAAAVLSGSLVSSWVTYALAYIFSPTGDPMLWANLVFSAVTLIVLILLKWRPGLAGEARYSTDFLRWDWIFVAIFLAVGVWMMFSTFSATGDRLQIGNHQWSDFGSNVSVMRSFSVGLNFPSEYPHFSGDRIRYHFLFYFLAANIEYLGLNPAWANNVLSIITLVSMLMLVMTLGSVLFASRIAGRIGAILFFFHGSLAYIPFFRKEPTWSAALSKIWETKAFLASGLPYRGEDWGVWSQVVYLNQRHLASSIGILLLVVLFLVIRAQRNMPAVGLSSGEKDLAADPEKIVGAPSAPLATESLSARFAPYLFAGCLLGLMPMWNGAVFTGAAVVLAVLLLCLPMRKEMLAMGIVAGLVAIPQIIFLKQGAKEPPYSLFHWGYTIDDPTVANVIYYLFFTFGFKWLLVIAALLWGTALQRKVMAAFSALLLLTFCFQFSEEVLANHKFLNIWLVAANLYAGYGLVRLWKVKLGPTFAPSRIAAVILVVFIVIGGVIDLAPIKNSYWVEARFDGDPFVEWVKQNTHPRSIFLSNRYVNHGILMAGRRLYYGHPYYAWGAGYPTNERDQVYKRMFESRDPSEVYGLIRENGITHVAIDDSLRKSDFVRNLNEALFMRYFPIIFEDVEKRYDNMKVFLVPPDLVLPPEMDPEPAIQVKPAANALEGGEGTGGGQFSKPRGITVDKSGNFYIADTGNSRVQKFSPDGIFLIAIGTPGTGAGQLREPNGVAVDAEGRIYVADALNHKLVRFDATGAFEKEWRGPEPGFYGPRDLAVGPNQQIFIVDQGRTRIVKFDAASEVFRAWGTAGAGPGQFMEPTGIEYGGGFLYVADLGNNRVQEFDLEGNFVRMWDIPEWGKYPWHYPDLAFEDRNQLLIVTNGWKNELLAIDLSRGRIDFIAEKKPSLSDPSSVVLSQSDSGRRLLVLNTSGNRVETVRLGSK